MSTRDEVLQLHNAGAEPEQICARLKLLKGDVLTKLAQCRREAAEGRGPAVRPDNVSAELWAGQTKKATPKASTPGPLDYCALVKAWNKHPVLTVIGKQFALKPKELSTLLSRLRAKGVPLKRQDSQSLNGQLAAIKAAAESVLTEEERAALTHAPKREGILSHA